MPTDEPAARTPDAIDRFFAAPCFAVVGASNDMSKFGAKVFAAYRQKQLSVYPVNPSQAEVQGCRAFPRLAELPETCTSVSVITPPAITEQVVAEAADAGARIVWLQPGAESDAAVALGQERGLTVIHGGPCVLIEFARI